MIVRSARDVEAVEHFVDTGPWSSARYLTRADGLGFSLNDTRVRAGSSQVYEYSNHIEACLCIEGEAMIEVLATGDVHELRPGTMYALDQRDRHRLTALTDLRLICVFNPALEGRETHDEGGAYAAST